LALLNHFTLPLGMLNSPVPVLSVIIVVEFWSRVTFFYIAMNFGSIRGCSQLLAVEVLSG